jgi:hypothetical protein
MGEQVYRVIAEGDDGICAGLSIAEALAVARSARDQGKRHVAIVNDETGVMVDERDARRLIEKAAEPTASYSGTRLTTGRGD